MASPLQQTAQWFQSRIGCLTASQAYDVLARSKSNGKPLKGYYDLMDKIIAERLTNEAIGVPMTAAMQWGVDHEDEARERYEAETGQFVELVGFIPHPEIKYFGASPDALVGKDGLLEIKCPTTTTHIRRIKAGVVPDEYRAQMLVQLLCTGRKWVDYVDYDPRLKGDFERLQFWSIRFEPTLEELNDAKEKCLEFLRNVDEELAKLIA